MLLFTTRKLRERWYNILTSPRRFKYENHVKICSTHPFPLWLRLPIEMSVPLLNPIWIDFTRHFKSRYYRDLTPLTSGLLGNRLTDTVVNWPGTDSCLNKVKLNNVGHRIGHLNEITKELRKIHELIWKKVDPSFILTILFLLSSPQFTHLRYYYKPDLFWLFVILPFFFGQPASSSAGKVPWSWYLCMLGMVIQGVHNLTSTILRLYLVRQNSFHFWKSLFSLLEI